MVAFLPNWSFFSDLAAAAAEHGLRGLLREIPFAECVYDIGKDAFKRYRERKQNADAQLLLRQEFEQASQQKLEVFEQDMRQLAAQALPNQPAKVQEDLALYLSLIPARIRQTFSRQEDPTGRTVPATWSMRRPEDVLPLLPSRLPRFRAGDHPSGAPKWELVERLGIGGFGEVWKARHTLLHDRFAAFKFCLDTEAQERLLRHEARIVNQVMSQVDHPNIVKLHEVDFNAEAPWLQYEYVGGGDLLQLAARWPEDAARRVPLATNTVQSLAKTVGFCHRLNPPVVHRDLKPANFLIARNADGKSYVKITDFGIGDLVARHALDESQRATVGGSLSTPSLVRSAHTPLYASPQQKKGDDPVPTDDVHALGVLWYQLLLGKTDQGLTHEFYPNLAGLGLTDEVIALLSRCVASDPERRPKDGTELAGLMKRLPTNLLRTTGTVSSPPPPPPGSPKNFTNTLGMQFVLVPRATFWMGDRGSQEQVEIPHDFYMGIYPVTQGQWQALMGNNPSWFSRNGGGKDKVRGIPDADLKDFPVECVSCGDGGEFDVEQFIAKLNAIEPNREWMYRLPTGAEWEYICRGGATSQDDCNFDFYFDQPTNDASSRQANFDGNYPAGNAKKGPYLERTTKVGLYKLANHLGVFDMHGNVWEWTSDYYEGASGRVIRGGSWDRLGGLCRASNRSGSASTYRDYDLGFRLARVPSGP